ncbi:MAG: hypothetical protein HN879_09850, partial [Flavobacteriaceae bacterium]|nr:hypothetical protein [Flavobacteriaceae bacterium]
KTNMTDYNYYKVIDKAYFRKIKDFCHQIKGETIKQFIDDVVYKHPNWNILLQNLSDIYVLVANLRDECDLKDGEKTWKEIMKKKDYDILKKNKTLIIGYMMVSTYSRNPKVHYIDLFDTIVRNYNLGEVMIDRYDDINEARLWPQNIIRTSAKYWANVLDLWYEDENTGKPCIDKKTIDDHIRYYKLDSKDLEWEHLYDICHSDGAKERKTYYFKE